MHDKTLFVSLYLHRAFGNFFFRLNLNHLMGFKKVFKFCFNSSESWIGLKCCSLMLKSNLNLMFSIGSLGW